MTFHAWLGGLLSRRHEDGTPKFTNEQIEDLVGAVIFTTGFEPGSLPPLVANAVVQLARRAQLDPHEDLDQRSKRLATYFEAHPLPDELLIDFRQNLRAEVSEKTDDGAKAAFLNFIDEDAKRAAPTGERPEGTRPGGALGFFLARGDLK